MADRDLQVAHSSLYRSIFQRAHGPSPNVPAISLRASLFQVDHCSRLRFDKPRVEDIAPWKNSCNLSDSAQFAVAHVRNSRSWGYVDNELLCSPSLSRSAAVEATNMER